MRCKWCGTDGQFGDGVCQPCKDSNGDPARYKPHTTHYDQLFYVDLDLFCARAGVKEAKIEPTEEQTDSVRQAVDRHILGTVARLVAEKKIERKEETWRDRPPLL